MPICVALELVVHTMKDIHCCMYTVAKPEYFVGGAFHKRNFFVGVKNECDRISHGPVGFGIPSCKVGHIINKFY